MLLFHVILGFIIPWSIGLYIGKLRKDIVIITSLFAIIFAFIFNEIGFSMKWWIITPVKLELIPFLPYNLGLFPVISCLMIYIGETRKINKIAIVILFTLLKTILEAIVVYKDIVLYANGWSFHWTFISYAIPCSVTYLIFLKIKRHIPLS